MKYMRDNTKDEYELKELQNQILKIAYYIDEICQKNNIEYYLMGGSALGAIRHKGFIPWDDDVDICMQRPDYDKFLQYIKEEKIDDNYEIQTIELNNSTRTFIKIINRNIPIKSASIEDKYLWIDVFPLDGAPGEMEEAKKMIDKNIFLKGQIYLRTTKCREILKEKKKMSNKILKILLKPITYRHKVKHYANQMVNMAKKYDYNTSEYIADFVWPDGYQSIFRKEWFENTKELKFEDELFDVPDGYVEYLTHLYGNYMKLPEESERKSHNILAQKLK